MQEGCFYSIGGDPLTAQDHIVCCVRELRNTNHPDHSALELVESMARGKWNLGRGAVIDLISSEVNFDAVVYFQGDIRLSTFYVFNANKPSLMTA